jgi:hypothetical protein
MATSVYFNNQKATVEQHLLEDLIIESIKNHGIDVYYIPRDSQSSIDELFGDDPVKSFTQAFKIEMYLESFQDYEGNKEFFGKFGLEIQETAKLCMARRTFERYVTSASKVKENVPKEGDLIYLPVQYKLMEIKFVEEEKNFFQLGKDAKNPYMYGLTVEAFKYNGEYLNTGMSEIDMIADKQAIAVGYEMRTFGGSGTYTQFEWVYQGTSLANSTARGVVANWNKPAHILKLRNIRGEFSTNTVIIGNSSNAQYILNATPDVLKNANNEDMQDNFRIETEADNILDFSEANPFGEP